MNRSSLFGMAAAPALAGLIALATRAAAQNPDAPWPCEFFVSASVQDRCLAHQQADADSALASLRRLAAVDARPALDSLASYAMPGSWNSKSPQIRSLLEARLRLEILRNLVISYLAQQDNDLRTVAPIDTRFRPEDTGRGLVAFFTNYANTPIAPAILLYSPQRDERRLLSLIVIQGRTTPFDWRQGWTFVPGDLVEVRCAQFRPRITVVR